MYKWWKGGRVDGMRVIKSMVGCVEVIGPLTRSPGSLHCRTEYLLYE